MLAGLRRWGAAQGLGAQGRRAGTGTFSMVLGCSPQQGSAAQHGQGMNCPAPHLGKLLALLMQHADEAHAEGKSLARWQAGV